MQPSDEQYLADLVSLADQGIGEGDFDEEGHGVPADLVELFEVIEAAKAGL